MKIGKIVSVERVPDTDKLLKLSVDFGLRTPELQPTVSDGSLKEEGLQPSVSETEGSPERDVRQVISGIAGFFEDPQVLVNISCPFVTNLEPRKICGLVSEAMIVAAHSKEGVFSVLEPTQGEISLGTKLN
ncbi:MAG: Methionyl-tRNA synthetase [Parcubacteria group bacterium GW2011_GWA2_43_11]|nr:MAG: Methionyl-tRNA synthetase [Parcubacteria group bacterium GW2011_GWA2_43_11]